MPARRLQGKTKHYKRGLNAKTPQEKMIDRLFRECETPALAKNDVCHNLGKLIEKGDELAIRHHDEGITYVNSNPIEDEVSANGQLTALFSNPNSEEYCYQSLVLSESNGFPKEFAPILKLRLTEDTYLCLPVRDRDWTDYKNLPPLPTPAEVIADILNQMKYKLEVKNEGHAIHAIHAVIKELLDLQVANQETVSFVEAAKLIDLGVIQRKNVSTRKKSILKALNGIPKELILIACEKQRMEYADQLISHLDYPIILAMVSRTSLSQVSNMVQTIVTRDNPLVSEKVHFAGMSPEKKFEELTLDDFVTFNYLQEQHDYTISEAVDFLNGYNLKTLEKDALEFAKVARKIRNCNAQNANVIMTQIFRSGTRIPPNLQIGACASANTQFTFDTIVQHQQIEMQHAKMYSPGIHAGIHELENMDTTVLVAAAAMSIIATLVVGRMLWNRVNIFRPITSLVRYAFFSPAQPPQAVPLNSVVVDATSVPRVPVVRQASRPAIPQISQSPSNVRPSTVFAPANAAIKTSPPSRLVRVPLDRPSSDPTALRSIGSSRPKRTN